MTWVTDVATLTGALTTAGYTQIANNLMAKEAPSTKSHKSYYLSVGDPDILQMTNNKVVDVRLVKLEINYRQASVSEYNSNVDTFESLQSTINALSPFNSFKRITAPERWTDKAQQATAYLEFYFGTRIY